MDGLLANNFREGIQAWNSFCNARWSVDLISPEKGYLYSVLKKKKQKKNIMAEHIENAP